MFEHIIQRLCDPDPEVRFDTMETLREMQVEQMELEDLKSLIHASTYVHQDESDHHEDASYAVVEYAIQFDIEDVLAEVATAFPNMSSWAKSLILGTLSMAHEVSEVNLFFDLLDQYVDQTRHPIRHFHINAHPGDPNVLSLFLPRLLEYADFPELSDAVYQFVLEAYRLGSVHRDTMLPYIPSLVEEFIDASSHLSLLKKEGQWDEEYQETRDSLALYVDLMGYINEEEVKIHVEKALFSEDDRVRMFACAALLRMGYQISKEVVESIAQVAEVRADLYDLLVELGKERLYPSSYYNQAAFAEANMINWLMFPSELGKPPTDIQLVGRYLRRVLVKTEETSEEKEAEFYLFKFKSDSEEFKEAGWMAGIAGCYITGEAPQTFGLGYTFSSFTPFDEMAAEEHVEKIIATIDQYWSGLYGTEEEG